MHVLLVLTIRLDERAVAGVYAVASIIAFAAYGLDKRRARTGARRTRESTLHLLAITGGWPGAWLGQRVFRHKTRKLSFQIFFWLAVGLHVVAWCWWWLRR
jgi:uncharacterized membrane protein YsdA (DUF1294 family)